MNREIEFKVWHKVDKEMYSSSEMNYLDFTNAKKPVVELACGRILGSDDIELLQYTNLKDRNNVKIFEGDIVEGNLIDNLVVFWDNTYLTYSLRDDEGAREDLCRVDNLKIVGNIYENMDLIQ